MGLSYILAERSKTVIGGLFLLFFHFWYKLILLLKDTKDRRLRIKLYLCIKNSNYGVMYDSE